MKFRKKPVVIEAIQFTGKNKFEICELFKGHTFEADFIYDAGETTLIIIRTLEGNMTAQVGDWIIKGVKNEFYPCKPSIFEATYEAVND